MDIAQLKEIVLPVCEEFEVNRLDVFGSMAKGLSGPESDADFLVEIAGPAFRQTVFRTIAQTRRCLEVPGGFADF